METHKAEEGFTMFSYAKRPLDAFGPSVCICVPPIHFTGGGGVQELLYSDEAVGWLDMRMFFNVAVNLSGLYGNLAVKVAHKTALNVCSIWTMSYM